MMRANYDTFGSRIAASYVKSYITFHFFVVTNQMIVSFFYLYQKILQENSLKWQQNQNGKTNL